MTHRMVLGEVPALAGLLPLVFFLLTGCARSPPPVEVRKLEQYGIQLETPAGWSGSGAGGTYEFRSPDGMARVRVGPLEGAGTASELKDAQLMAGTGAQSTNRVLPPSPTKVGPLFGVRARLLGNDGRLYDIVALNVTLAGGRKGVVLVQTSVSSDYASQDSSAVEALFTGIRQSIQSTGVSPGAPPSASAAPEPAASRPSR